MMAARLRKRRPWCRNGAAWCPTGLLCLGHQAAHITPRRAVWRAASLPAQFTSPCVHYPSADTSCDGQRDRSLTLMIYVSLLLLVARHQKQCCHPYAAGTRGQPTVAAHVHYHSNAREVFSPTSPWAAALRGPEAQLSLALFQCAE